MKSSAIALLVLTLACTTTEAADDDLGAADTSSSGTSAAATTVPTTMTGAGTTASTTMPPTSGPDTTSAGDATASSVDGTADATAGSDSGPVAGDCSGALLCDDFEDDAPGMPGAPWAVSTSQATLEVIEGDAYSGTRAIHITTEGGDGTYRRAFMSVEGAPVFPIASNVVWGRMMARFASVPAGAVHWTNIQGEGDVEGMGFRGLYRYGGMNDGRILANYETQGVGSDCWRNSQTVMPSGTWTCLEWHYDGPTDTMEFFVDGAPIDDVSVIGQGDGCITHDTGDNWYAPVFDTMRLGWEHYQATGAQEMWLDDVALDDERIGCPG